MRFCILHKPMGGSSPPPPGYATAYRAQAFKFCVHSVTYLLINVYMPSGKSSRRRTQRDQMFIALQNYIENESFDYLFVVGDFNVTLSRLDSSSSLRLRCLGLTAPLLLLRVSITSLSKPCYNKTTLKIVFEFSTLNQKSFHTSEAMQPHYLIEFTFLPLYNTN